MDQRTKLIVRLREQGVRLSVIRELCGGSTPDGELVDLDRLPMDRVIGRGIVSRNGLLTVA